MTPQFARRVLWVVALGTLVFTLMVSSNIAVAVARGPLHWNEYDERLFRTPTREVVVTSGPGIEVVVSTATGAPNYFAEASYAFNGPMMTTDDNAGTKVITASCPKPGPLPVFRRWCHLTVNLQVPPGVPVHAASFDGGIVRKGSDNVNLIEG